MTDIANNENHRLPALLADPSEFMQKRLFVERQVWKELSPTPPFFSYAQYPVFSLSPLEAELIDFLALQGLNFRVNLRPDPTMPIRIKAELNGYHEDIFIDVNHDRPESGIFAIDKGEFAEHLKDWLNVIFGEENELKNNRVVTRHQLKFQYLLPFHNSDCSLSAPSPLLFRFNRKERYILGLMEKAAMHLNLNILQANDPHKSALFPCARQLATCASEYEKPPLNRPDAHGEDHRDSWVPEFFCLAVYPRQSSVGSLELVANLGYKQQPARLYVSGFQPISLQLITDNTPLGFKFKECLDLAIGEDNLDVGSSRFKESYLSFIYNLRLPYEILELWHRENEQENGINDLD